MTRLKKLTALLVSAALALSLLAGCGGSKALSQVIADLLSGMYNNVTVEVDPDLTAALKKAAAAGSIQEEVLAALVEELNLSGIRLTLRQLDQLRLRRYTVPADICDLFYPGGIILRPV